MSESADADWEARADELHDRGGLPPTRAKVIALRERGLTYNEIGAELDITRGTISEHVSAYRDDRDAARWLLEHGPDSDAV